jgi:TonB family protein
MTETEFNAADQNPEEGKAPALWDESDFDAGGKARFETALPRLGEAPDLRFSSEPMRPRSFSTRRSEGGLLSAAVSLAVHALVIAGLLIYAPWDGKASLQDEDEISVEIVDSLPQPPPALEPATSPEQAPPVASEAKASDTEPAAPPATESEPQPPAPSEAEASPPPAEAPPPPEAKAPPPAVPAPAADAELQTPPPPPAPIEATPPPPAPPVRQAEPAKVAQPTVDLAQRERAERVEREKREEAERAVRERAARAAENAKRQEAQRQEAQRQEVQRQEAQRQAAQHQEAERQARAKAAEAAASNAAATSAYRTSVIGHLASFKRYPPAARARGAQGTPAVSFSIDASGRVVSVSLTHASGDPDIDAEIVAMVHRASPFPAPPPGAPHVFSAGVNFRLQ